MIGIGVNDELLGTWRLSGHPYKVIAAEIATWAKTQERGTAVPPESFFEPKLDFVVTSAGPWIRAKRLLEQHGVLRQIGGPYEVA